MFGTFEIGSKVRVKHNGAHCGPEFVGAVGTVGFGSYAGGIAAPWEVPVTFDNSGKVISEQWADFPSITVCFRPEELEELPQ